VGIAMIGFQVVERILYPVKCLHGGRHLELCRELARPGNSVILATNE
jgi:hypothetical protein